MAFPLKKLKTPETKNKYSARRTDHLGRSFDSKGEARCFDHLRLLELAGEIQIIQQKYKVKLTSLISHNCDFLILDKKLNEKVLIEFKGFEEPVWGLKKKLYQEFGPLRLRIYRARGKQVYLDEEIVSDRFLEGDSYGHSQPPASQGDLTYCHRCKLLVGRESGT